MLLVDGGSFTEAQRESFRERLEAADKLVQYDLEPFCLAKFETTYAEFHECVLAGACVPGRDFPAPHSPKSAFCNTIDAPCDGDRAALAMKALTFDTARAYCDFRGDRLPTYSEWFWAATGGTEARTYPWGEAKMTEQHLNVFDESLRRWSCCSVDEDIPPEAWSCESDCLKSTVPMVSGNDGYPANAPPGSFPAGAGRWGHMDLLGNVGEIVRLESRGRVCGGSNGSQPDHPLELNRHECTTIPGDTVGGIRCAADPRGPRRPQATP
jgi:formylglycine-generating enzyme required for sulfatase activity